MDLDFPAELAVFLDFKLAFSLCVHVNFIPFRNKILVFTDGTN